MELLVGVFIFVCGLFVGSFLNVLIDRTARNEDFVRGRSYCESCHHPLIWNDLFPLLSFISLRGRCRYCSAKIPPWLPLIELATGTTFILVVKLSLNLSWWLILLRLAISLLFLIIFFTDLKYRLIYDLAIYLALALVLIYHLINGNNLGSFFSTSLVTGLFFYGLYLITKKRGLGLGDIQLGFLLGFLLGFPNILVALYLAFLTGALVGIILMLIGKANLKTAVPFGPFLILATLVTLFWGDWLAGLVINYLF